MVSPGGEVSKRSIRSGRRRSATGHGGRCMKRLLCLVVLVYAPLVFAGSSKYDITILGLDSPAALYRPEYEEPAKLVGRTIAGVFGPISEVRVESEGINLIGIEKDAKKFENRIRDRIDLAKCLGRDSEVAWHKAPWVRGYLLLENGRILPIDILLSGIVVGELLFSEQAGAANADSLRR